MHKGVSIGNGAQCVDGYSTIPTINEVLDKSLVDVVGAVFNRAGVWVLCTCQPKLNKWCTAWTYRGDHVPYQKAVQPWRGSWDASWVPRPKLSAD